MKIDLHNHTSYGSACAYMEPDQLVERAKAIGLGGVCITEHDQIWNVDALERLGKKHDFLVIGGVEVNTDCGEILAFGIHESVLHVSTARALRNMVDRAGGVMILAHPFRYRPNLVSAHLNSMSKENPETQTMAALCRNPVFKLVDGMEVYNGHSGFDEIEFSRQVAERLHLQGTGGSDAHAALEVGSCYCDFEDDIEDEQDFIEKLKTGRFQAMDQRWSDPPYEIGSRKRREAF